MTTITTTSIARKWSTPQLLKAGLLLTWGTSVLVLITSIIAVQSQRQALKTIGKDAAPSVMTALRLKDSLAGMDAYAANELLLKPGAGADAIKGYNERLDKFAERMVAAAENITYGDAERQPILTLQRSTATYIAQLQQARDRHNTDKPAAAIAAYLSSAKLLDETLIPAATTLERINFDALQKSYNEQVDTIAKQLFLTVITGLLLVTSLVALQLLLNFRVRRTFNPLLLVATLLALIFLGDTVLRLSSAAANLKDAKSNAFVSLYALRQARALAYGANADESRYLLDSANAAVHERAFFAKANQIAKIPPGATSSILSTPASQVQSLEKFTGSLADALTNITYPGEGEAALANLKAFVTYLAIDQKIRQLQTSGNYPAALALGLGTQPGQSDWAFQQFKDANAKVFDINWTAFTQAIDQGTRDLDAFEVKTSIILVVIALLTFFGLQPRLIEYTR